MSGHSQCSYKQCFGWAIMITLALWFTGLVTVPFSADTSREVLALFVPTDSERFGLWAHQLENVIYAVGRLPILFAFLIAIKITGKRGRK